MRQYNTVSRIMATMAVRLSRIPCLGYFDVFVIIATESAIQNDILVFDITAEESERGTRLEFLGVTVCCALADPGREAHLSTPLGGVKNLSDEIKKTLGAAEILLAQMQKLVGKLNFAQTSLMARAGRATPGPPSDMVMRGEGNWIRGPDGP